MTLFIILLSTLHLAHIRHPALFAKENRFGDLNVAWSFAQQPQPYRHPKHYNVTPYFPLVYWLLCKVPQDRALDVFRLAYLTTALTSAILFQLPWWAAIPVLLSYPIVFSDDRGAIDHTIGGLSAVSVGLLTTGHPIIGAIALGVAVSTKGYPATLGLLWLLGDHWLGLGVLAMTSILCVVLPSITFKGGLRETLQGMKRGLAEFYSDGVLEGRGPAYSTAHYSVDWFNAIRILGRWQGKAWAVNPRHYLVFSSLWALGLVYLACTGPLWVVVLSLGLVSVVWPNVANDYKLAALLPGVLVWMTVGCPGVWVMIGILGLFVPKAYWYPSNKTRASIACILSPVATIILTIGLALA